MAKTQTSSTLSPYRFSTGNGIYVEDARAVVEMQNFAYGHNPTVHGSMATGIDDWGGSGSIATHGIELPTASGYNTYYTGRTWIDPDVVTLTCEAEMTLTTGNEALVRFTIGASNVVLTTFNVGTDRNSSTIATSATGTGWRDVTIEISHSLGSDTGQTLNEWTIEDSPITSSLPDPVDE